VVEELRYKPDGHGFDTEWCSCDYTYLIPRSAPWFTLRSIPRVESAANRNECQGCFLWDKGGRCLGLSNLLPLCADIPEILKASTSCSVRPFPGLWWGGFNLCVLRVDKSRTRVSLTLTLIMQM